jgi:hypothetical protein
MSNGTVEEEAAQFLLWQDASHHEAIRFLQSGDCSAALSKLEEIFRHSGRCSATPHYLIYEAALQVLETECPNPVYRPGVVLAIHDRTAASLSVLARQYCYERTTRDLRGLASPLDLQYEAVPYAITAGDWRDSFENKAGAVVTEIADALGGAEKGHYQKLLRIAQLKIECEEGEGESRELPKLKADSVLSALNEAEKIATLFWSGEIPSITNILFGEHEEVVPVVQPAGKQEEKSGRAVRIAVGNARNGERIKEASGRF